MLELAARNTRRRSLDDQLTWLEADAKRIPFNDGSFDLVVSSDSLHHWQDPLLVLDEIARVLRSDGKYLIHDLKRPQQWLSRLISWLIGMTVPRDVRTQYQSSVRAAYTAHELGAILRRSRLERGEIREELLDITLEGRLG
jgi:ubiquinone/menaquinone biosynthesis C-methylase UbiE